MVGTTSCTVEGLLAGHIPRSSNTYPAHKYNGRKITFCRNKVTRKLHENQTAVKAVESEARECIVHF